MSAATLEVVAGLEFLYSTLHSDSALIALAPGDVSRGMAPPGTATPYVIIGFQAGSNSLTVTGVRPMVSALYQCKAVGPASNTVAIAQAAAEIDAALGGKDGLRNISTANGFIADCHQETPLLYDDPTPINGEQWTNIGGLYRLWIQQMT